MTVLQQRPGPTATSPAPQLPPPGQATPPGVGLEHDFLSTASSALRRLHFKSAGGSRVNRDRSRYQSSQQPPVPKLVIMGSSTSSNNTINTSTDSANTVNTMVTGTDCDQDTDTEMAAAPRLARKSIDDILCASLSLEKEDDFFSESSGTDDSHKHPAPPPPTPLLGAAASIKEPRFVFIKTEAETDEEEEINMDQGETFSLLNKSITVTTATVHNGNDAEGDADTTSQHSHHHHHHHHHRHSSKRRSRHGSTKSISSLPRSPSSNNNHNNNNKNNHHRQKYNSAVIPQPPDLRVDFFSESLSTFTPVAVMEDGQDALLEEVVVTADGAKTVLLVDGGVNDYEGRGGGGEDAMNGAGISNRSSSLSGVPAKRGAGGFSTSSAAAGGGGGGDGGIGINTTSASVTVNTTANPLVNITVGTSPTGVLVSRQYLHHHPKQSIVVQQSSIGGSPTVATVLLKNCAALQSTACQQDIGCVNKTKQREENMKQLLDVANTLTLQELHDFEMKYGSPHHSRSQSVKTPGSRSNPSGRPNYLCLPQQRSRVASMPNTGVEEEYYRLRHFSITGKGIVNRGDSLKSKRSKSNTSVTSSNSSHSTEHLTTAVGGGGGNSYPGSARTSATTSLASSRESSTSNPGPLPYRVVMLGAAAVGKSSLISQFMTSEYLHAYDTSLDDEFGEKTVSVLLDGDESELTFIDHPCSEMSPENCIITYEPHAYCVVYSTVDRTSLRVAEETLQHLWKTDSVSSKAVILVGNKTDLVRSRVVTTDEGKNMATSYDCKFIETSVGINHNVDELLVGLLTQIRLKLENPERSRDLFRKRSCSRKKGSRNKSPLGANSGHKPYRGSRTSTSLKVKGLLGKVWARDSKSKSCENLHVL